MNVLHLSARAMARLVRERAITSAELMMLHIQRIEEVNPTLNAVVLPLFDFAMEKAREADRALVAGTAIGPLHGVPFSVKDSIDIAGARTTAGTVGFRHAPPAVSDATVVVRLRGAGAIPIAKTNLPDLLFAYESDNLLFGRTSNPYDLSRTAGGSSGGESALLAAGGSPLGLGSDAAGSVRIPAAFCGLTSLKPTSGRLPRTGHVPPAGGWLEAIWQIGPMARHVEDVELALDLLSGPDEEDYTAMPASLNKPLGLGRLRVAVYTNNGASPVSAPTSQAVYEAARALERRGAEVTDARPPGVEDAYELEMALLGADGCRGLDDYITAIGSTDLHPILIKGFLSRMRPRGLSVSEFGRLWGEWDRYRARMQAFFQRYDAVVCPVYTGPALRHGESALEEHFRGFGYTMAWNMAGNPAATVRCGQDQGLPLNVQVITARWQDRLALEICKEIEAEFGGWQAPSLLGKMQTPRATAPDMTGVAR